MLWTWNLLPVTIVVYVVINFLFKELEGKVCEKCTELEDLYQKAKSELDKEYEAKESLKKQLDEYVETNLKLKEEFEQCSSASKENVSNSG